MREQGGDSALGWAAQRETNAGLRDVVAAVRAQLEVLQRLADAVERVEARLIQVERGLIKRGSL